MFRTTLQKATDALTSVYNAFNWVAQNPGVVPILVLFKIRVQLPRCPRRIPLHLNPVAVLAGPRLPQSLVRTVIVPVVVLCRVRRRRTAMTDWVESSTPWFARQQWNESLVQGQTDHSLHRDCGRAETCTPGEQHTLTDLVMVPRNSMTIIMNRAVKD